MLIKFSDISPSPFRDLVRNPPNEEKIAKLMASIGKTGYWENTMLREITPGKYELAYGWHRLEAAKRSGMTESNFIVKNLSDSDMIRVMKDENDELYGFSAASLLESVRAVVNALAEGRIAPFEIPEKTKKQSIRYAPSFVSGEVSCGQCSHHAYTALSVAEFLGEVEAGNSHGLQANASIRATLDALSLIESQELSEASLKGLSLRGDKGLVQKVKAASANREARLVLKADQEKLSNLDAARHAAEQKEKERQAEIEKNLASARKAEDEASAKQWAEEQRVSAERAAERVKVFEEKRARLDEKVEASKERAEVAKQQEKYLPTRHKSATIIGKLSTIISERNSFRGELASISRDKTLTQADRERIRQGLLAVSEWYAEQAIQFRPPVQVDVLKEAIRKENAKQKREEQ